MNDEVAACLFPAWEGKGNHAPLPFSMVLIMDEAAAIRITTPAALDDSSAPPSPCSTDFDGFADHQRVAAARSVFALDCVARWGLYSVCGRRPEMEDAALVVPRFFDVPLWMVDGLDRASFRLPAHFFGVFDGHGGVQVASYCRERIRSILIEELGRAEDTVQGTDLNGLEPRKQWERAFVDCFTRVDAEVRGNSATSSQPVALDTVGSTAVVAAVLCSSHIIVANCGDSRAVLCRGKQPLALLVDHKHNREMSMRGLRLRVARSSSGMVIEFSVFLPCHDQLGTDT